MNQVQQQTEKRAYLPTSCSSNSELTSVLSAALDASLRLCCAAHTVLCPGSSRLGSLLRVLGFFSCFCFGFFLNSFVCFPCCCLLLSRFILDPSRVPSAGARWHLRTVTSLTERAELGKHLRVHHQHQLPAGAVRQLDRFMPLFCGPKRKTSLDSCVKVKTNFGAGPCRSELLSVELSLIDPADQVCVHRALLLLLCAPWE